AAWPGASLPAAMRQPGAAAISDSSIRPMRPPQPTTPIFVSAMIRPLARSPQGESDTASAQGPLLMLDFARALTGDRNQMHAAIIILGLVLIIFALAGYARSFLFPPKPMSERANASVSLQDQSGGHQSSDSGHSADGPSH